MSAYSWPMIEAAPGRAILAKRGDDHPGLVIEADYAVLSTGSDGRPAPVPQANLRGPPIVPILGLDGLRAPDAPREKPFTEIGGAAFWTFGLLIVALSFWTAGGHALFWH